ncbi:MAG: HAMP domain-containing protein [SAR324 cluster bacterium]|nr:HAMP domain-containing protein [SAR324 cluster bacterium]
MSSGSEVAPKEIAAAKERWATGTVFFRSITFKNLSIFLPIFLIALAPLAYFYWQDVKANRIANLAMHLELIAEQSALRIDPGLASILTERAMTGTDPHLQMVETLREIQQDFDVDNAVLMRKGSDGNFTFVADGTNQFFITQPVFIHEDFPETLRAARNAWENQGERHTQLFGFGTFEYLQVNKRIELGGQVVALLLINKFAEDVDQAIKMETLKLLSLSLVLVIAGGAVFWLLSSRLLNPLVRLKEAANQLAAGDLEVQIDPVKGRDEVARLNDSFRTMVQELRQSRQELQSNNAQLKRALARVQLMEDLEKNLASLVPRSVRSMLHTDPGAMERGKTETDVTVLFLDIEGSTLLAEAMEAEQMDRLIQEYFSHYLDFIYENQGDITETAGDGLMILFQGEDPSQHALNAVKAAIAIQQATQKIRLAAGGQDSLRINIGINSGTALVGFTKYESISGDRVTFTASGRTTILAARLQGVAHGGSTLVSDETMRRVAGHHAFTALGWRAEDMGRLRLKNLHDPERVHKLSPDVNAPAS